MAKLNSTAASLLVATLAAGAVALGVEQYRVSTLAERKATATTEIGKTMTPSSPSTMDWVASAPGRVEPQGGTVRLGAQLPGQVTHVLVRANDTVKAGDLLVVLNDSEQTARMPGALAEIAVRKRERDEDQNEPPAGEKRKRSADADQTAKLVQDFHRASDKEADAARAVFNARMKLDAVQIRAAKEDKSFDDEIGKARQALMDAKSKLATASTELKRITSDPKLPLPTRLESGLATARSEITVLENAIERTRIRAPSDGTVLAVKTKRGEIVTPSPQDVLITFGNLSDLQIRAEVEERDVSKIATGQTVVVRSDAFPGQDFKGTVNRISQSLGSPHLAGKGPRRPMEREVMEVMIKLADTTTLLPGMRVDVFFQPAKTAKQTSNKMTRNN